MISATPSRTGRLWAPPIVRLPAKHLVGAAALLALAGRLGTALVDGSLTIDLGVGRRVRPLGPRAWRIEAPRETVFEVLAAPYSERAPRALRDKVQVWERGHDVVLAAHITRVRGRDVRTVEMVRFEAPERIGFRLLRGPVPHVVESFELEDADGNATLLTWSGELGTDLGVLGEWWGDKVAAVWERTVATSIDAARQSAEARAGRNV